MHTHYVRKEYVIEEFFMEFLKKHVVQNYKEYMIMMLFFISGIFFGVFFINRMDEAQKIKIEQYLVDFISDLKAVETFNQGEVLTASIHDKLWLTIGIWFFGTTIIGIPIVIGLVIYRGFCLGYTIAISISYMGFTKGFLFVLITLLLQNIIFIPALIGVAVSGFKFYQSIVKDRRKENIKISLIRHTILSSIMLGVMIVSCLVEVFISTNLLKGFVKYF